MTTLWFAIGALLLLAAVFMAWPLWRYRHTAKQTLVLSEAELNARLNENVRLFREHLRELENNLASQAIDAEQFAQLKVELERNLLDDESSLRTTTATMPLVIGIKTAAIFSLVLLILAVLLYQQFGSAADVSVQALQQQKMQQDYQSMLQNRTSEPALTQALIGEYQERVKAKPQNTQYWFLLARAQMEVSNFTEAVQAYQHVLELDPQSSMVMAELAQAMFLRDGNKVSPPIADLAKKALSIDPKNTMALGLTGIDAFHKKDYREAIRYWQKTIDLIGPEAAGANALLAGIERAKEQFVAAGGKAEELTTKSAYALQVSVRLGDKVKAAADQTVFIYARAWQGSPMPLAIIRVKVSELPKVVTLDETMAMSPAASLATATEIEVVARISSDGTAQTKVGDWQVKQGPISMQSIPEKIELQINEQVKSDVVGP